MLNQYSRCWWIFWQWYILLPFAFYLNLWLSFHLPYVQTIFTVCPVAVACEFWYVLLGCMIARNQIQQNPRLLTKQQHWAKRAIQINKHTKWKHYCRSSNENSSNGIGMHIHVIPILCNIKKWIDKLCKMNKCWLSSYEIPLISINVFITISRIQQSITHSNV